MLMATERSQAESNSEELNIGHQVIEIYRAWSRIDQYLDPVNQIEVIETELVDQDFEQVVVASRNEAIEKLKQVRENISKHPSPLTDFLCSNISATCTYIQALGGQAFDLSDYALRTIGIEPKPANIDEIRAQKEKVDEAASQAGIEPTIENYDRHFNQNRLTPDEIRDEFEKSRDQLVPIVAKTLGLSHLLPLAYEEHFIETDKEAFWAFHSANRRKGAKFEINIAPHIRWVKGRPGELAHHEIAGHLLQQQSWRLNIDAGIINPAYGVIPAPSPESWQSEGVASSLPYLIPELYEALDPIGKFTIETSYLNRLIWNEIHIRTNEGVPVQELKDFFKKFIPYETDDRIEKGIRSRTQNPFARTYQLTYSDGTRYFVRTTRELGPEKSIQLLKALYEKPMTPLQIKNLVSQLKAA